ncbi:MAG: (2Fe-2S)-binding protein, partial [Chloroflexi bacterium]|nr:(2Fe-2S)-binding protein [Chloroflexota bacterium]
MASNLITLNIDGQEVKAKQGSTVLAAALGAGIYIPTLCYHPHLEPYGGCRMCIVEIEKMRGLPPACTTPAGDGMVVKTKTPQLQANRRSVMEFVLTEHPHSCLTCWRRRRCRQQDICLRNAAVTDRCVTCPKNQRCELQQVSDYLGIYGSKQISLPYKYRGLPWNREEPFIDRDNNLCILCGRCIRACQDIRVNGAIAFSQRGGHTVVSTAFDCGYKDAGSEFCGSCVDVCPVGAIMERKNKWAGLPDRKVSTTCAYCGVGCKLQLEMKGQTILRVAPDPSGQANQGFACVKGRFGIVEMVHSPQRLTSPLIRQKDGEFKPASWD